MASYIITIVTATVIAAVISVLTPEGWNKYVGVVTGIVVTVCIARPVISIVNGNFAEDFKISYKTQQTDGEGVFAKEIKREMEYRIATDIRERLRSEFGRECSASVSVAVKESGEISGVNSIRVRGDRIDNIMIGRLREVYGATEVSYEGP